MELDIVTLKSYSILKNFQFKISENIKNTDMCLKLTSPCKFEEVFHGIFLMKDFDHKLSSLIVQSLRKFSIGLSEKVHIQKNNSTREMYSDFKDNGKFEKL